MDLKIELEKYQKKIDEETGSILFFKKDFKGIPDKVINGDGWTIELKDESIVMIDIYKPKILIESILNSFDGSSIKN
ncbi:MAG: hypothetical protein M1419_03455 [Bacteroidetes bacterium]|nr:hypothetical protein [Bacteroidota bacterium]